MGCKKPCRLYMTACDQRTTAVNCWLYRFKRIPRFCVSVHKTMKDECRAKGKEKVYIRGSYYGRAMRAGLVERFRKRDKIECTIT